MLVRLRRGGAPAPQASGQGTAQEEAQAVQAPVPHEEAATSLPPAPAPQEAAQEAQEARIAELSRTTSSKLVHADELARLRRRRIKLRIAAGEGTATDRGLLTAMDAHDRTQTVQHTQGLR